MYKPKVVFHYVEAGMGHIMPIKSISSIFEKKYGDYVEIFHSHFYSETNDNALMKFEQGFVSDVKVANTCTAYGFLETFFMNIVHPKLLRFLFFYFYNRKAVKKGMKHMEELHADMQINTHFSTALLADTIKENKPLIVSYNPDVYVQPFYRNHNDLVFVSSPRGYYSALKHKKDFNENNLKLVPFAIREEAFKLYGKKEETKKIFGLNDNLTIVLFEGGYGLGKMGKICKLLAKCDLDLNVIAICGKNKKLFSQLQKLNPNKNINLIVEGFCDNSLEYLSCADIFMGKSGASSVAEPTFFGVAEIITKYATTIERGNAKYYIEDVKNAVGILNPKKAVKKVEELYYNRDKLQELKNNALKIHNMYGSELIADEMFNLLCTRFPHLKEEYEKNNK